MAKAFRWTKPHAKVATLARKLLSLGFLPAAVNRQIGGLTPTSTKERNLLVERPIQSFDGERKSTLISLGTTFMRCESAPVSGTVSTLRSSLLGLACLWMVLYLLVRPAVSAERPNFLIFMADDQYRSSVGCYGATPSHTPNIDQLAQEGLRFTQCFTPSSICTPNRAAFLSGMLPLKNGAHANHSGFYDDIRSLPNYMRDLNYRACLVNKDGLSKSKGLYDWEFFIHESEEPAPGAIDPQSVRHRKSRFDEIEAFLSSDDPRPFCMVHASRQPHKPHLGRLPNGLTGYDASNFYMDSELGRDLALLDKYGLREKTIVIYVNDNEANQPRTKYTLWDTAVIVPCIVRWPGHTQHGSTTDAMVSFLDFLPTLVEIAGGQPNPNWDGKSMIDVWEGKTDRHHESLYSSYTGVTVGSDREEVPFPIRSYRTARYKYLRNLNHGVGHPKQDGMRFPPEELYDLEKDPKEQTNLAEVAEFQETKRDLSRQVDAWMAKTADHGIESELEVLRRYPAK